MMSETTKEIKKVQKWTKWNLHQPLRHSHRIFLKENMLETKEKKIKKKQEQD
jgi:hypothetical protein